MSFSPNQWARGAIDASTPNLSPGASHSDRAPDTVGCSGLSRRPYGLIPEFALGDADRSRLCELVH